MKVILSGGGTGGHIYPALAIAEALKRQVPKVDILYVGTENGLEKQIVPRAGYAFETIKVSGIDRSSWLKAAFALGKTPLSLKQAWDILKAFKPDIVIGTGGYVSFPIVYAASYYAGCKTYFHEQNAKLGLANRRLAERVDGAFLTFAEAGADIQPEKVRITGLPVRKEMVDNYWQGKDVVKDYKERPFQVLVFGGSRGADSINNAMLDLLDKHSDTELSFNWITGTCHYEDIISAVNKISDKRGQLNVSVSPYLYEMGAAMSSAHLAVCRAGAGTISELMLSGLPAILVPYPYAAEGHQEKNARALKEKNAVHMIIDDFLDGDTLFTAVKALLHDEKRLHNMRAQLLKEAKPNALQDILATVLVPHYT